MQDRVRSLKIRIVEDAQGVHNGHGEGRDKKGGKEIRGTGDTTAVEGRGRGANRL